MYRGFGTEEKKVYTPHLQNDREFDPDVHLSYIGDKVRSLLGHFQKDFEGDVGKDDLGAKYGAYGSFLPVYERSPPNVSHLQNKNIQRYPNDTSTKKLQQDTTLTSRTALRQNDMNGTLLPVPKAPTLSNSLREDVCLSSTQGTTSVTANRPVSPFEQKPDKDPKKKDVHVLAKRTIEIYRELGLDSPSSSEEKSPQSGRLTSNTQKALAESPMTTHLDTRTISYPGEHSLASPSDNLLCKELISDESIMSILENMISFPIPGGCLLSPLSDGFLCLRDNQGEVKCESTGFSNASNTNKKKSKDTLKIKVKASLNRDVQSDWIRNAEKRCSSFNGNVEESKDMRELDGRSANSLKRICRRDTNHEQVGLRSFERKEHSQSGDKKKLKKNQCDIIGAERIGVGSYATEPAKRTASDYPCGSKTESKRLSKDSDKRKRSHHDSDSALEQSEKRSDLLRPLLRDGPQGSKPRLGDKENQTLTKKRKVESSGKMFEDSLTEVNPRGAPAVVPLKGIGLVPDAASATVNPTELDDWVSCDICGKWRLLPFGTNAEQLEEDEWHCRMLNWLPGMNHCDISEEETTKALYALYQFPLPDCPPDAPAQCHQSHSLASFPTSAKKRENFVDDGKHSKFNVKGLVSYDGSGLSRKMKSECLYHANEKNGVAKAGKAGIRPTALSKGIHIEKPGQKHKAYSRSNDTKSNKKVKVSALEGKPKDRAKVSLNGAGRDMGCSGTKNGVVERETTKARPSSICSFQDDRVETLEEAKNAGTRKKRPGLINGFLTERNGQNLTAHSSSSDIKYNRKVIAPALVKKPSDLVKVSFSGEVIKKEHSDNVKIAVDKRKTSSHISHAHSYQESREETNTSEDETRGKLSSGVSNGPNMGKDGPKPRLYSSSNESNSDQGRVSASAKNPTRQFKISLRGRSMDMVNSYKTKNAGEKPKIASRPSSVRSIQDSEEETSEVIENGAVTRKLVSRSSDGLSNEKDGQKHRLYPSFNDSTSYKKDGVSTLEKIRRDHVKVSLDGKSLEIKDSDKVNIVHEKRESGGCPNDGHSFQDNGEESNTSGLNSEKKASISISVCKEDVRRKGNGNAVSSPVNTKKVIGPNIMPADTSCVSDVPKQLKELERENGSRDCSTTRCTQNGSITRDCDAKNPVKNNSSYLSIAKTVIKEGNDLKIKADRLKDFGSELESTGLFFQAALKYFRGAFILELCVDGTAKFKDVRHSIFMYRRTAELCESVALAYERCNEMAAAAMAYKCMEVAYIRIGKSRTSLIKEDFHEIHMGALEYPSPAVSDPINQNRQGKLDKVSQANGDDFRLYEDPTIVAAKVPKYDRVLNNTGDVFNLMQALVKHQRALAAAEVAKGESKHVEGLSLVKLATSSGFLDIEELIRRVQIALDALFD